MKKCFTNPRIKWLMVVVIIGIVVLHLFWGINFYSYHKYTETYDKTPNHYVKDSEKYTYTIKCPSYLNYTGNFAISTNGELNLFLIIWPANLLDRSTKYGVILSDKEITYSFYINENIEYLSSDELRYTKQEEQRIRQLIRKHERELSEMLEIAAQEWSLPL